MTSSSCPSPSVRVLEVWPEDGRDMGGSERPEARLVCNEGIELSRKELYRDALKGRPEVGETLLRLELPTLPLRGILISCVCNGKKPGA